VIDQVDWRSVVARTADSFGAEPVGVTAESESDGRMAEIYLNHRALSDVSLLEGMARFRTNHEHGEDFSWDI
jgi:hypothetical protein